MFRGTAMALAHFSLVCDREETKVIKTFNLVKRQEDWGVHAHEEMGDLQGWFGNKEEGGHVGRDDVRMTFC